MIDKINAFQNMSFVEDHRFIEFDNEKLTRKTQYILNGLPEFGQGDFFDAGLRYDLVRQLELKDGSWDGLFSSIWRGIGRYGFVRIRNLPFDANNRLSVALASVLGEPLAHNRNVPALVRRIKPRAGDNPQENCPHTDSPHWIQPNDLITLECEHEDQYLDVSSRIVPVWEVEKALLKQDTNLYTRLFSDTFPFILILQDGDDGYQMKPVLTRFFEGGREVSHVRYCLTDSISCVQQYGLEENYLYDLGIVEEIAANIGKKSQFVLREGDWLIFDNKRCFHSKTRTSEHSGRTLKKMKLNINREDIYA